MAQMALVPVGDGELVEQQPGPSDDGLGFAGFEVSGAEEAPNPRPPNP